MSDKTTPLFVRPAEGDASRQLSMLERAAQGGPKVVPAPAPPAPAPAPAPQDTGPPAAPPVRAAGMRRRHWGLLASFLIFVLVPVVATGVYLWTVAEDQYGSVAGFTVRQEEGQGASELLGGLAALAGGNATAGDSEILYEFIRSQALIQRIDDDLDIRAHYSARWEQDPVFALKPDASIEELASYWERIVRVSHDQGAGLIELRVRAFDRDMAQAIGTEIVARSQEMINDLNAQAREDAMRFARDDLEEAVRRLSEARSALTGFRSRTQIVDPEADIQGRMGVMNNLQQQLAQALIDLDLLSETTSSGDPRLVQANRRIEVIRDRLARERVAVARGEEDGGEGKDYPTLIAEYEGLVVEREFTEQNYRAALAAMDLARDDIARQSRYLATYIRPTLAETPEYPQRDVILGLAALFSFLSWAVGCLIFYSIRDRG